MNHWILTGFGRGNRVLGAWSSAISANREYRKIIKQLRGSMVGLTFNRIEGKPGAFSYVDLVSQHQWGECIGYKNGLTEFGGSLGSGMLGMKTPVFVHGERGQLERVAKNVVREVE